MRSKKRAPAERRQKQRCQRSRIRQMTKKMPAQASPGSRKGIARPGGQTHRIRPWNVVGCSGTSSSQAGRSWSVGSVQMPPVLSEVASALRRRSQVETWKQIASDVIMTFGCRGLCLRGSLLWQLASSSPSDVPRQSMQHR